MVSFNVAFLMAGFTHANQRQFSALSQSSFISVLFSKPLRAGVGNLYCQNRPFWLKKKISLDLQNILEPVMKVTIMSK